MADVALTQGQDRIKLVVDNMSRPPVYAISGPGGVFVFIWYDTATKRGVVLMVDGNHGASITNAADKLIPFIHRDYFGRRGIHWGDVRWLYRDSMGAWDEILVTSYHGENLAGVAFRPLADRTLDSAFAVLVEQGFLVDAHDRAHISNAINRAEQQRAGRDA